MVSVWRKAATFDPRQRRRRRPGSSPSRATCAWTISAPGATAWSSWRRGRRRTAGRQPRPRSTSRSCAGSASARARWPWPGCPTSRRKCCAFLSSKNSPMPGSRANSGIPLGTVKSRVRLAVNHLRRLLDGSNHDPPSSGRRTPAGPGGRHPCRRASRCSSPAMSKAVPQCRDRLRVLEPIGGAMLKQLAPAVLPSHALAEHDGRDRCAAAPRRAKAKRRGAAAGQRCPRACVASRAARLQRDALALDRARHALEPGHACRTTPRPRSSCCASAPARKLPCTPTAGSELTQVLHGPSMTAGPCSAPGDFDETDGDVHHQPKVQAAGECICLASVERQGGVPGRDGAHAGSLVMGM